MYVSPEEAAGVELVSDAVAGTGTGTGSDAITEKEMTMDVQRFALAPFATAVSPASPSASPSSVSASGSTASTSTSASQLRVRATQATGRRSAVTTKTKAMKESVHIRKSRSMVARSSSNARGKVQTKDEVRDSERERETAATAARPAALDQDSLAKEKSAGKDKYKKLRKIACLRESCYPTEPTLYNPEVPYSIISSCFSSFYTES